MTSRIMPLEQVVGRETYLAAGLNKLDLRQQNILVEWIEARVRKAIDDTLEACREHGPKGPPPWSWPGKSKK